MANKCVNFEAQVLKGVVRYHQFNEAFEMIEKLHKLTMNGSAAGGILFGEPGVGKTTCIKEYERSFTEKHSINKLEQPLVVIEFTKRTSVNSMLRSIIYALGGTPPSRNTEDMLIHQCEKLIKNKKVLMIFIDEAQNLLSGLKGVDTEGVFDTLKSLMNKSNVSIVLSGLPHVKTVFGKLPATKRDLRRRFKHSSELKAFSVESWSDFQSFVSALTKGIPMKETELRTKEFHKALLLATKGNQHEVASIFVEALGSRVDDQEELDWECFREAVCYFDMEINPFDMKSEEVNSCLANWVLLQKKAEKTKAKK